MSVHEHCVRVLTRPCCRFVAPKRQKAEEKPEDAHDQQAKGKKKKRRSAKTEADSADRPTDPNQEPLGSQAAAAGKKKNRKKRKSRLDLNASRLKAYGVSSTKLKSHLNRAKYQKKDAKQAKAAAQ